MHGIKHEPDFERVRTALFCGQPDHVPLAELKMDQEVMDAFMGKPVRDLKTEVEFWVAAGYDYVRMRPAYDFHQASATAKTAEYSVYGNHMEERSWASESKGVIANDEDFEKFSWPKTSDIDYSKVEEVHKHLPDGMKLITGCSGIYEAVWMLMGFETFSIALIENPQLVERMFNKFGEIYLDIFTNAISCDGVGAGWFTDDIAYTEGMFISPEVYRKHLFPWMRKMAAACRERDIPFLFHSDGDLWPVMDDLIDIGVNAIQPIEPKAMDIGELKEKVGDKLCLIGNIDLGSTLTLGTPEDVAAEVRDRIDNIGPGGGYCVGSSNTVTNYVPLENFLAMIKTTLEYGKYPLGV